MLDLGYSREVISSQSQISGRGLRNLAIIALTESKTSCQYVADLFGLSAVQVSRIRADYRQHGSAGLARSRGRPLKLSDRQVRQARLWAGEKVKHGDIARRLNVSPLIQALLKEHGPLHPDQPLDSDHPWDTDQATDQVRGSDPAGVGGDVAGDGDEDGRAWGGGGPGAVPLASGTV